jgi:aerobic carbon-monoxide dehydrogenase medium subunit
MIPAPFEYIRAASLQQAIDLLQNDAEGTKLIAGGHTLIPAMKLRLASPALLVDIRGIEELKRIEIGDQIIIGALTTHAELLASEPLRQILPIFHEAANMIADPQVRNRGTIGGSLANADPASDWPAVVIALKAEFELEGPNGRRRVAAKDFFLDIMTTELKAEEVLVAVYIARPTPRVRYRYRKIRHPASRLCRRRGRGRRGRGRRRGCGSGCWCHWSDRPGVRRRHRDSIPGRQIVV